MPDSNKNINFNSKSSPSTLLLFFLGTWFLGFALIYFFNSTFVDFSLITADDFTKRMRFSEFSQIAFSALSLFFIFPILITYKEKLKPVYYASLLLTGLLFQFIWSLGLQLFSSNQIAPLLFNDFSLSYFVNEVAFSVLQIILVTTFLRQFLMRRFPRKDHQLVLQILTYIGLCLVLEVGKLIYFKIPLQNEFSFYLRFLPSGLFLFLILLEYKTDLTLTLISFLIFYTLSKLSIHAFDTVWATPLPLLANHLFYYTLSFLLYKNLLNYEDIKEKLYAYYSRK